jgi:MoaA/NifB/PqqE/SkfB family radical SAM enzyme
MAESSLKENQKNQYRALWEFSQGISDVESTPPTMQIARSNQCNFKCVYCIDHRTGNQIPRNNLNDEVWNDLLGLIPKSMALSFHGISEFMIDPQFFDIVKRCADAGVELRMNTNGSVCTPKYLEALASYPGHLTIDFSLDAASADVFTRIRGWDFWRVVRNIKTYVDRFRDRRNRTWMTLSFVITKSSVQEMLPFLYLGKALEMDSLIYYRLHEYGGLDWRVETKSGGDFDYREEITSQFAAEYNKAIGEVRKAADILGMRVELPATLAEKELEAPKPVEVNA